jgi:hypothetical protein
VARLKHGLAICSIIQIIFLCAMFIVFHEHCYLNTCGLVAKNNGYEDESNGILYNIVKISPFTRLRAYSSQMESLAPIQCL